MNEERELAQPLLRVGVIGAGPWARRLHAPMFAGHPATELAGVWGRRRAAAEETAAPFGAPVFEDLDQLFARCDAVAFAVPPDVQVDLAMRAARAGKAVLLEKPLALDVASAERLAATVADAGVGSQLVLSWRYAAPVRELLAEADAAARLVGGRGVFVNGAMLGGPFATPWRLRQGPLFDLGPHVIDALDAALGPVQGVQAHGRADRWVGLLLEHERGACSEVSLSSSVRVEPGRAELELYTDDHRLHVDAGELFGAGTIDALVREFVHTARHGGHRLDAAHGLRLQRIIEQAFATL